jgi:CubicO group peptidase (beta-lactamase class C family)
MVNGGADGLTEGTHELKIEIRPYLDKGGIISGDILASGQLKLNITYPEVSTQQSAVQEVQPGSDWALSSSKYDKEKIIQLNKKILQKRLKEITSIVVIKNGKLLLEEYFNGASRETLHDTRSVGKSFASAMMGIAIKDGFVKNENQLLRDFYDLKRYSNYSDQKDSIKIKDLLMMASLFNGSDSDNDSPGNEEKTYPTENWVKFALDLPIDSSKKNGRQWDYFTAGVVLLGDILNRTVPGGLEEYASHKLFQPLGIRSFKWEYTPQHVVNTAGGLRLRALDLAKFGQMYKADGRWKGNQILPKNWVNESLSPQIQIPGADNAFYGYLFWNKTYTVGGKKYEVFYCSGNGGNKVFMFKDLPLVIVITSTAFGKPYAHLQVDKMMEEFILPAVIK